jgi:hypothetical protein
MRSQSAARPRSVISKGCQAVVLLASAAMLLSLSDHMLLSCPCNAVILSDHAWRLPCLRAAKRVRGVDVMFPETKPYPCLLAAKRGVALMMIVLL